MVSDHGKGPQLVVGSKSERDGLLIGLLRLNEDGLHHTLIGRTSTVYSQPEAFYWLKLPIFYLEAELPPNVVCASG